MIEVPSYPLDYYVEKLVTGEPFTYLSYGDGELLVAAGARRGRVMQSGELVTLDLEQAIEWSLKVEDPTIIRGTDPNLLNWRDYKGTDYAMFSDVGRTIEGFLSNYSNLKWVDGVVWENSSRDGLLEPLIRALRGRIVVLIGNQKMVSRTPIHRTTVPALTTLLKVYGFVPIPRSNAAEKLEDIYRIAASFPGQETVYIACMGLSAAPLGVKLLQNKPNSTYIDLGSSLDILCGLGSTRGWRRELYQNPKEWEKLVQKNLGGLLDE